MNKFGLPDGLLDTVKTVLEKMDPVDKNALGKTFTKRKDKDIDNDGDVDSSDKYLHRRRKAIKKAMGEKKDKVILNPKDDDKDIKEDIKLKKPSNYQNFSYTVGRKAALNKKPISSNPHPKDSEAHKQWSKGHSSVKVDELSKATKTSYVQKATTDLFKKGSDMSTAISRGDSDAADKATKKATKRAHNIQTLIHKGLYKKEDVQRDVDFKMVKVRLPDGKRVWRKVRKSMKVGGVKGQDNLHKAFYDEKDPVQEAKQQDEIVGTLARGVGKVVGGAAKLATKGAIGTAKLAGKGIAKGVGAAARGVSTAGRADRAAKKALALKKAVANQRAKNMARAKLDREKANIDKYKAQLQKAKGNVPTQQKAPVPGTNENTEVKSGLENPHNCATHVYSEQWGEGRTISTMHADPDAFGNVSWYDVMFEHGIEKEVQTKDLKIIKEKHHGHLLNKKEKK